jgi:benzoyl-CoA reductase/2-hydroxyglutaryl-CoA dehydratase subunit BcrC/BadD/HgdB
MGERDDQFDGRFRQEPRFAKNPGAEKRSRVVTDRQKEALAGIRRRPPEIEWFVDRLGDPQIPPGSKVVATLCNTVPVEPILALGAVPARIDCGNPALVPAGEEVLSGEICPLAKATFAGFLDETSLPARAACIVVAGTCDAKRKLGEALADYKPTFVLPLPPEQDYDRYWKPAVAEIERLVGFLEEHIGERLRTGALRSAIDLTRRRTRLVRELAEVRAEKPEALSVRDLTAIVQSGFVLTEPEEWIRRTEAVLEDVRTFAPTRERLRPRLVLTGAPIIWPNFKPLNLIEECGADVVADTLCSGVQSLYDPVVVDERGRAALLRALAQRYFFAAPCPCFVSSAKRLNRVLELAERHRADGVVHYGLRLCQLFDMEVPRLSAVLKERRIPFMSLRTDYSLEDTEQLRVRLEAFLETLA